MKIKTRRYYYYYFMRIGLFLLGLLPMRLVLKVAEFGAGKVYPFLGKYKHIALRNLRNSLDESEERIDAIARGVIVNLAKNGAEWIKLNGFVRLDPDRMITEIEGEELLREACSGETGNIALTGHFGNWELVGIFLRHLGLDGSALVRKIYFHKYGSFIENLRRRYDVPTIYRDESPKKILRLLKKGGLLGMLADQDIKKVDGIFVDYFGRECFTPTAPVKLALRTGAKIVMVFLVRKPDNTHKLIVQGVLDPSSEKEKEGVLREYTQKWTDIFEEVVREYPDQWVWVHDRWKTRRGGKK